MVELVNEIRRGRVLEIRLTRPDQMNALSAAMVDALRTSVQGLAGEPSLAAAIITGAGRAFCAGADLIEAREQLADPSRFRDVLERWRSTFAAIEDCPKPIIAVVDGIAVAGGLELALACDLIVSTDRARIGDGHISYGLVPGGGGSRRLPDAIGSRGARWLMYTGQLLGARDAHALGLVQQVISADEVEIWIKEFSETMGARSAPALAFMKSMTRSTTVTGERLAHEVDAAVHVVTGVDAAEGLAAFQQKRAPTFPSTRSSHLSQGR